MAYPLLRFWLKRHLLFFLLGCLQSVAGFAQTGSEYYRAPFDTTLYSPALAQARQLTVVLPTTFNARRKTTYPLIVVFDRQNRGIFRQLIESIDYLTRFDAMPEAVIIGVSSAGPQRTLETSLRSENKQAKGEGLIRFVFDELVPWCEATYHTGACRNLIGHSRFGYLTTVMLCRQASQLSSVIALSPFYRQGQTNWVDSVTTRFAANKPLPHKLFYRFVTGDSLSDTPDYARMLAALRRTPLNPKFDWEARAFYTASHNVVPGLGVMPALLDVFHEWAAGANTFSPYSPQAASASYPGFLRQMRAVYGAELGLGVARLNGLEKLRESLVLLAGATGRLPLFHPGLCKCSGHVCGLEAAETSDPFLTARTAKLAVEHVFPSCHAASLNARAAAKARRAPLADDGPGLLQRAEWCGSQLRPMCA